MAYWLLKSDPHIYSFDNLVEDERTIWDGVKNAQALLYIRAMHDEDRVLIYHSGDEPSIVGIGTIESDPYPDPEEDDPKLVVINIRADKRAASSLSLAKIKADPFFADMPLVRQPRLSIMPVTDEQWRRILDLIGLGSEA
jgi:predicted RNA-binding protein with PUA-like domain